VVLNARKWLWSGIFVAGISPVVLLVLQVVFGYAGADPAQYIVLFTGIWALRFLWISLAITPLRQFRSLAWLFRFRRMLGLYALFYAILHLFAFATFILGWRMDLIYREFTQRPYILVGLASLAILILLGITSTQGWKKRLGRRWIHLHQLVYLAAILALIHYLMQIRAGYADHLLYSALLLLLLGYRVQKKLFKRKRKKSVDAQ
jgi:sulfoxide reductase heme-binding subunit YedZ